LKIAYDYKIFWSQRYGGISRYFSNLFFNFHLKNIDFKIFAPFYKNHYIKNLNHSNLNGKHLNYVIPYTSFIIKKFTEVYGFHLMRKWKPDIIHYTYYYNKLKKTDKPTIITVYDLIHEKNSISNNKPFFPKKNMIELADHIICISEKTRKDLIEIYGVQEKKTSVIYLGSEHAEIQKTTKNMNLDKPYILFVGSREKYKNFNFFIKSYAESNKLLNNFDIVLFGGGNLNKEEKKFITKNKINENSIKYIFGDDELLMQLYQNAGVFVFPSLDEGFGIPVVEALKNKCPVICSDIEIFREIGGDYVKYFNIHHTESLTKAIEDIMFSIEEKNLFKEKGYTNSKKFSWKKCADETLLVYKNFL
jgi:glycosyltransferase involved in cell wall biosynthesis